MKCKMRITAMLMIMVMLFAAFPIFVSAQDAQDVIIGAPMFLNADGAQIGYPTAGEAFKISVNVMGNAENARLIVGFYKDSQLLNAYLSEEVSASADALTIENLTMPEGSTMRLFVWDNLTSSMQPLEFSAPVNLRGTAAYNRVMLFWDAADSYNKGTFDVYRDGEKIGTAKTDKGGYIIETKDYDNAHSYYVKDELNRVSNTVSLKPDIPKANDILNTYGAWISKDDSSKMTDDLNGPTLSAMNGDEIYHANETNTRQWFGYIGTNAFSTGLATPDGDRGFKSPDNESNAWIVTKYLRKDNNNGRYWVQDGGARITVNEGTFNADATSYRVYVEYWNDFRCWDNVDSNWKGQLKPYIKIGYTKTATDKAENNVVDLVQSSSLSSEWKVAFKDLTDAYFAKKTSGDVNQIVLRSGNGYTNYIRRIAILPTEYVSQLANPDNVFDEANLYDRNKTYTNESADTHADGFYVNYKKGVLDGSQVSMERGGRYGMQLVGYKNGWPYKYGVGDGTHAIMPAAGNAEGYNQVYPVPDNIKSESDISSINPAGLKPRFKISSNAYVLTGRDPFVQIEVEYKSSGITSANLWYKNLSGVNNASRIFTLEDDGQKHTAVITLNDMVYDGGLFGEGSTPDFAISAKDGAKKMSEETDDSKYFYIYSVRLKNLSHRAIGKAPLQSPTLYLMGDSICQTYGDTGYMDGIQGWGEMVGDYLGVAVDNKAVAGSTTKTFPNYNYIYDRLAPGDYVTVQFGHNDSLSDGRHVPLEQYKKNLQSIIDNAREKGATPILLSSTACFNRNSGNLKRTDDITPYRAAMKATAEANGVMFVDVFKKCLELFDTYNWKYDPYGFIVDDGGVHLTAAGAREVAKAVLRGICETGGAETLKRYIRTDLIGAESPAITDPADGAFAVYADAIYADAVYLRWGTPFRTDTIGTYKIYRKAADSAESGDGTLIGTSSVSGYYDTADLTAETEYIYTVYADQRLLGTQKIKTTSAAVTTPPTVTGDKTNYIIPTEVKLFIAGDSTAEPINDTQFFPASSWGNAIDDGYFNGQYTPKWVQNPPQIAKPASFDFASCGEYFTAGVYTINKAIGGRTVKQFISEGRLDDILKQSRPGDYLFIQFGHNEKGKTSGDQNADAVLGGYYGTEVKGIEGGVYTADSYEYWLKYMADKAREKGMKPVILNSILEYSFDESGAVLDENPASGRSLASYRTAAKNVAEDLSVPFIDIAAKNNALLNTWGAQQAKYLYLYLSGDLATQYQAQWNNSPSRPTEDYTHLSYIGADEIAKLVVGEIKASSDSDLAGLKNLINPKAKLDGRNPGSITGY